MYALLRIFNLLTLAGWPFLVWLTLKHPHWHALVYLLVGLFLLRWFGLRQQNGPLSQLGRWLALAGALLCATSLLLRSQHLLLWYPVAVNALMLLLFTASLYSPIPLIERLARLREPDLPLRAIRYTRRVTQIWCLFFLLNGSVSLLTCLPGSQAWWTLWNGCISYLLTGALMGGEWLVRQTLVRTT